MSTARTIELYKGHDGKWRWRVRGANSSDILSDSGQGYERRIDALETAATLHPSLPIIERTGDGDPEP